MSDVKRFRYEVGTVLGITYSPALFDETGQEVDTGGEYVRSEDFSALVGRLQACQLELDAAKRERDTLAIVGGKSVRDLAEASLRLDAAMKFVGYIATRYEEGRDEPVTERFYNEARSLLAGVVERGSTEACPLCGRTDAHTHTSGPFGMS